MGENSFEVGQIYKYTDNTDIYSIRIDRVGNDNIYFSTMSPRRIGGGNFHKGSEIAKLLTLSDERDGILKAKDQRIKELEKVTTEREDALADLLNIEAMSTDQLQSLCFRAEEELASRGIFV